MNLKFVLLLIVLIFNIVELFALTDSIGIVKINGEKFIAHKVEKGEGLSAVARRYNWSVDAIKKANGDTIETLNLGQIIYVPLKNKSNRIDFYHKVGESETLYGISKKYNVSIEEIIKWNKLSSNSISLGDKLKIIKFSYEPKIKGKIVDSKKKAVQNDINVNEVYEDGAAGRLEDPSFKSKKSLALHATASMGTVIKVTNLLNNKVVYVKVVGHLPENKNSDTIIMLSKFAADKIDFTKKYIRVKLFYLRDSSLD